MAALFADFTAENDETDFLFDFIPTDAQFEIMNEEEDAQLNFGTTIAPAVFASTSTLAVADASFEEATINESFDSNKDGTSVQQIDLAPTFSLKGNFSEIVDSLVRRYGEPLNETEKAKLDLAVAEETIVSEFDPNLTAFQRSVASDLSSRRITINGEEVIFQRNSFQVFQFDFQIRFWKSCDFLISYSVLELRWAQSNWLLEQWWPSCLSDWTTDVCHLLRKAKWSWRSGKFFWQPGRV